MEFLIVILLIISVGVFYVLGKASTGASDEEQASYPYFKNTALLTAAELSFHHVLTIAVDNGFDIYAKVRVADIISVNRGLDRSTHQTAFNKIQSKHVDFVLVNKKTSEIVCAIELDDSSHQQTKRQRRDEFLDAACIAAKLPLLRFNAQHAYKSGEIEQKLSDALISKAFLMESNVISIDSDVIDSPVQTEACPKCGAELVKRESKRGKRVGETFMGCSNFPQCRFAISSVTSN